jgi:DNA invertase Pin-like site-specific DNA recombinase
MSEKIRTQHLERKAILYVRQSSPYQVIHNLESQKLQYAMEVRLRQLGWHEIEVVDEDLGRSAAGSVTRAGFERMVAEVCLGKVGAVAAREVSRFARNSREWQQLVEVCRVVDTVLIDQEMVYAPRLSNDRLLLGLKGSLNEYELDLLRQRSVEARREKARRGELVVSAPIGYIKSEDQRLEKDPDMRVQQAILLVFRKTGHSAPDAAVVPGTWAGSADAHSGRRDTLEKTRVPLDASHADQSCLWRCLRLWEDRTSHRLRGSKSTPRLPPQTKRTVAGPDSRLS